MNFTPKEPLKLDINDRIRDLIGLDPAKLAEMNPTPGNENDRLLGLQAFTRRILELAVTLVDRRSLRLSLKTKANACRVHRWPDVHSANFAMLCLHSLITEKRWWKGLPFAPLEPAQADVVDLPVQIDRRHRRMSLSALIAEWQRPMVVYASRVGSGEPTYPVPAYAMIRDQLKLEPAMLTNGFFGSDADIKAVFDGKPIHALAQGSAFSCSTSSQSMPSCRRAKRRWYGAGCSGPRGKKTIKEGGRRKPGSCNEQRDLEFPQRREPVPYDERARRHANAARSTES